MTTTSPFPQMTPTIRARGKWTVRTPFAANFSTDTIYTCLGVQSFSELSALGFDIYNKVYVPVGLTNGVIVNGSTFDYATESLYGINIISLVDSNGTTVYIPDNYILSFPNSATITYNRFVLSVDIGALPATTDVTALQTAIVTSAQTYLGISSPTVNIHQVDMLTSPTYEQHLEYERVRLAAATLNLANTPEQQLIAANAKIAALQTTITTLTQLCIDNGIIKQ